jgi:alpha-L-glutamate ligase-like protein
VRFMEALRNAGVLGINRRNAEYTLRHNRRALYPRVDDKLTTKRLCAAAGIPVPPLLGVARHHFEVAPLVAGLVRRESFVLKPVRGAMGNGIVVIVGREGTRFLRASGRAMDTRALRYHAESIISGLYALAGQPDAAMVEERLEADQALAEVSFGGVPDVRVIVYRGIPVMCMTRLPTRRSDGRANLHQGALGAGVHLARGLTVHAVQDNLPVTTHPDTGRSVIGIDIAHFDRVLEIAVQATDTTGLGYVGADVVVDRKRGPVILELNARPGLAIQIANHAGLRPRLDAVDAGWAPELPVRERIARGRAIALECDRGMAS